MAKDLTKPFGMMEIKSTFVFIYIGKLLGMLTSQLKPFILKGRMVNQLLHGININKLLNYLYILPVAVVGMSIIART